MKPVIIVGFGGFGREIYGLARDCGRDIVGFLDDNAEVGLHGRYQVLGSVDTWTSHLDSEFVVAIGNPRIKKSIVTRMETQGTPNFATLVHPSVQMDRSSVSIGRGTVICAGCVGTVDFTLGHHVIVNIKCTLAHDDIIGDFVTIAPLVAVSGNVTIEDGAEIGTAACIRQGVKIGRGAMLGMGGVLVKDIEPNALCVGSPAKPIKELSAF